MAQAEIGWLQFMYCGARSGGFRRTNCGGPGNAEIIGETRAKSQISALNELGIPYCAVSVKTTAGCPNAYCPSAFTCTVPGVDGSVRTTEALPVESVVTI